MFYKQILNITFVLNGRSYLISAPPMKIFFSELTKFATDMKSANATNEEIISSPFFGSMISLIFRKVDE